MHIFGLAVFAFIAAFWVFHGVRIAVGARKIPQIKDCAPAEDAACPSISLIFAARDEEEKLPAALATLAALDYPSLEIIAVDDRSKDATGRILDEFAAAHPRFHAVHVTELPEEWLGKPHALQKAYEASHREWLLLTDADVRFEPSVLRRAVAMTQELRVDHLTLGASVEMHGFWEKTVLTFFGLAFHVANRLDQVSNVKSKAYAGIGAFQLVKRSVYEAIGTHRKLRMEVVDDMKIGKLVKEGGFRSAVALAQTFVTVRWQAGVGNIIRGVTKNFFAAFGYSMAYAGAAVAAMLLMNVVPFAGMIFAHGWMRVLAGIAASIAVVVHAGADIASDVSPLYGLTHPLGAILFCYMIVRSAAVTLWNGGVTWRDTFYPLEDLRRGVV